MVKSKIVNYIELDPILDFFDRETILIDLDGPSSWFEISFFKRICSIIYEEHFLEEDNFFLLQKKKLYYKLELNGEEIDITTFS